MQLENKGVLVTGGASGLGAACVRSVDAGRRESRDRRSQYEKATMLARNSAHRPIFVQTNVTEEAPMYKLPSRHAVEELGSLSVAINCAGIGPAEKDAGESGMTHPVWPPSAR